MAMELLEVDDAAMAKYFTVMLNGTTHTWLKGLPPNSIGSWPELKARFIQNFKDTCKQLLRLELALVFLEEERVMQQSSVSISLSFSEPRYQSSRRPLKSPMHLHKQTKTSQPTQ